VPHATLAFTPKGFAFLASGDGKTYTAMVFANRRGFVPSAQSFKPGEGFAAVHFT
jgi:hypothetical protein